MRYVEHIASMHMSGNNGATIVRVSCMDSPAASSSSVNALHAAGQSATRPVPKYKRARRTNNPLAGMNTNTARGRRIADLVRSYLAALENPADVMRQATVIQAAELQVLAEEARTAALQNPQTADLDGVVRMQGAADRALRRLGIKLTGHKWLSLREILMGAQS